MAISVVQRNMTGNAAVSTNPTLAFGGNTTAGNAIIAVTFVGTNPSVIGIPTDSLVNTYTQVFRKARVGNGMGIAVHIAYLTQAGANTVTFATGFNNSAIAIFEVAGLANRNAFDTSATQDQSSATALDSTNTPTTRFANELLLGLTINVNNTALNPTIGAGYSNLQTAGVTFASSATEEKIVSATGNYNATFTLATNATNEFTAILAFSDTPWTGVKLPNTGLRPHSFSPGLAR